MNIPHIHKAGAVTKLSFLTHISVTAPFSIKTRIFPKSTILKISLFFCFLAHLNKPLAFGF